MKETVNMIVLATTPFGEKSAVVHTICREYGRRGFLVNVGKGGAKSKLQPLSVIQGEASVNSKSALWRLGAIDPEYHLTGLRTSMSKNAIAVFISEVLFRTVREGAADPAFYDWCLSAVLTLDALEGEYASYHIRFLLELAVQLGFSPDEVSLSPFAEENLSKITSFLRLPLAEALMLPMSGAERTAIASSILRYLEYHTESAINIRSLGVLHEIFATEVK
ncbi:MAG: DNA repair protein RecO C-terminal domain-containing protein [Bacteroidales bacterium]|nr:DNA repair protein RecO C-terminal domain-containing protein [Bacteroidales bacterium]